jgi:hypothetical protein
MQDHGMHDLAGFWHDPAWFWQNLSVILQDLKKIMGRSYIIRSSI